MSTRDKVKLSTFTIRFRDMRKAYIGVCTTTLRAASRENAEAQCRKDWPGAFVLSPINRASRKG